MTKTNELNSATPPFQNSKQTALFLIEELYGCIESRLGDQAKANIKNLLGFLTEGKNEYSIPDLTVTSNLPLATETLKFIKFYLEFNHIADRFHRIHLTREQHLVPSLLSEFKNNIKNITPEVFKEECEKLNIDLVFTAHPTEIYERKILKKYGALLKNLEWTMNSKLSIQDEELQKDRKTHLLSLWLSPNHRKNQPSPKDEAKLAQMIYQYSLWNGLSQFKRLLHSFLREQNLPLDTKKNIFKFYSWMGGDRDGNPFVTAKATRSIVKSFMKKSINLYYREFKRLKEDLSFDIPEGDLIFKPEDLINDCLRKLSEIMASDYEYLLLKAHEDFLIEQMDLLYERLVNFDAKFLADQKLLNMIDRLNTFGLIGMNWDIRQESSYHDSMCDEIFATHLPSSFSEMSEEERLNWIKANGQSFKSWMQAAYAKVSEEAKDFIDTFKLIAEYGTGIFKYYIISMSRSASDLILIHSILRSFDSRTHVTPLFETLEDLEAAPEVMNTYFNFIAQTENKNFEQLIMLGYSDSAKTGSRLSSVWSLYLAQKELIALGNKHGVACQFFHGRGGSVGRGGGPVPHAIKSCPIESVKEGFRITVQGEVIFDRYGYPEVAVQSMMTYLVSLLNYKFAKRKDPEFLNELENIFAYISDLSKTKYRELIEREEFYDYFEEVTPVNHMGDLNIGSRPSKRKIVKTKSYRAIPWIFGWTQNRSLLPNWYGAGTALKGAIEKFGLEEIKKTYDNFFLFESSLDLIYASIHKADFSVFEKYQEQLGSAKNQKLFTDIKNEYQLLTQILKSIVDTSKIENLDMEERLQGRLEVLSWLNDYQIFLLKKEKQTGSLSEAEKELLILSIQGIASGLGNTG